MNAIAEPTPRDFYTVSSQQFFALSGGYPRLTSIMSEDPTQSWTVDSYSFKCQVTACYAQCKMSRAFQTGESSYDTQFEVATEGSLRGGYKVYNSATVTTNPTITGYSATELAVSFAEQAAEATAGVYHSLVAGSMAFVGMMFLAY